MDDRMVGVVGVDGMDGVDGVDDVDNVGGSDINGSRGVSVSTWAGSILIAERRASAACAVIDCMLRMARWMLSRTVPESLRLKLANLAGSEWGDGTRSKMNSKSLEMDESAHQRATDSCSTVEPALAIPIDETGKRDVKAQDGSGAAFAN